MQVNNKLENSVENQRNFEIRQQLINFQIKSIKNISLATNSIQIKISLN